MKDNYQIDNTDLKILSLLSKNAKTPYTEIAKKVFVSGGTVHVRMKKLEKLGIVKGNKLVIDYSKLGYSITIYARYDRPGGLLIYGIPNFKLE